MKIKCIANTGQSLSQGAIEAGSLRTTKYSVDIGKEYIVYGISTWKNRIDYLLTDTPFWCPAELFVVINPLLAPLWYFSFRKYKNLEIREAILGYREMALDYNHHDALINRNHEAVEIFYKRKEEIDEFEEMRNKKLKNLS